MPEKFTGKSAEDVARAYVELEGKLGNYKEHEALAEQLKQYGGWDNVRQWAAYGAQAYQQAQQAHSQAQPQPHHATAQGQQADPFENWDLLTPREQASKLSQLVGLAATNYINTYANQVAQGYGKQLQDALTHINRQWDIYRQVMGAWRKDPTVDPDALLQTMVQVATGDVPSLMQIAQKQLLGEGEVDRKAKGLFEQWKADEALRRQNEQVTVMTGAGRSAFSVPAPAGSRGEATNRILQRVMQDGTITPAHLA